jgi:5-formyltetrahydrofolate cyclo-ligase
VHVQVHSSADHAKAELRAQLRAALRDLSPAVRAENSAALCARVIASSVWQAARAVLLFFPVASEPDISPLLAAALTENKLLALPRFNAALGAYETVRVTDPARELVPGPFQVREPAAHCVVLDRKPLDLALVPGLGFDARGGRLGRGKGHYDRLLAGFTGSKLGVTFDCQLVPAVPREPHDIALDAVVTPTRWLDAMQS